MSKIRQQLPETTDAFDAAAERDLDPWVIFTQLRQDAPFLYAGWLDAVDARQALVFAREHYGQDQVCTRLWAIPRSALASSDGQYVPAARRATSYQSFVQAAAGDIFTSAAAFDADDPEAALAEAVRAHVGDVHAAWVAPVDAIEILDDERDCIWRHTDQTYRLARGYSKDVREKWEQVRRRRDLEEYEKDDLKETF